MVHLTVVRLSYIVTRRTHRHPEIARELLVGCDVHPYGENQIHRKLGMTYRRSALGMTFRQGVLAMTEWHAWPQIGAAAPLFEA
ncbi:MAG: hypothetical protein FJX72_16730 [Armatimonadetes bacterium]|nr:hypothetical protein [Armatimonadota bacterium]